MRQIFSLGIYCADHEHAVTAVASDGALLPIPPPPPSIGRSLLSVGLPFLLLAITYSLWFVSQKVFNNQYRTNAFGYSLSLSLTLSHSLSFLSLSLSALGVMF